MSRQALSVSTRALRRCWLAAWFMLASAGLNAAIQETVLAHGLRLTIVGLADQAKSWAVDSVISSNLSLYVPAGQAASPFAPPGKFSTTWTGFFLADLRAEYGFTAELQGTLRLSINGQLVYEAKSGSTNRSGAVRLNKGTNSVVAEYLAPGEGDAFLRLFWIPPDLRAEPVPLSAMVLSRASPEQIAAEQTRRGRQLFLEYRCHKCHRLDPADEAAPALPELSIDAPDFDNIGSRLNRDWMAGWILNPRAQRPDAQMPRLLAGAHAKEEAGAISAFLSSLGRPLDNPAKESSPEMVDRGKTLFDTLHCEACHQLSSTNQGPSLIPLVQVQKKFTGPALEQYLVKPEEHFKWTPMPNFRLSFDEAALLAAYLRSIGDKAGEGPSVQASDVELGKKLVAEKGCLNCHALSVLNRFSAPALANLPPAKWNQGCLAEARESGSAAPDFGWNAAERAALQAFGGTDRQSLRRHVPIEFASRQTERLNCAGCHGRFEGFPPLGILGGKLNPAWSAAFISGAVAYKPRPWLDARMPGFIRHGEWIARALAMQHGYPPKTPAEGAINPEPVAAGQKLVSPEGGFSCISCHAVGKLAAVAVFESAGINLAYSGERLLKPYFERWIYNPPRIDPETKMPVYFVEGKSSLTEILGGDADQQINALWEYVRLGAKMPLPPGVSPP